MLNLIVIKVFLYVFIASNSVGGGGGGGGGGDGGGQGKELVIDVVEEEKVVFCSPAVKRYLQFLQPAAVSSSSADVAKNA